MIELNQIALQFGHQTIIDTTSFTLFGNQKFGVIGQNGAGKTSLFSMIRKVIPPTHGDISIQNGLMIAAIEQEFGDLSTKAIDYVIEGHPAIGPVWKQRVELEKLGDYEALADIYAQMQHLQAYDIEAQASKILHGLGFQQHELENPIQSFSGGWRMRLNLARCLIAPSDLMLLDEPTNHLDLDSIIWLQDYLKSYRGSLLIISHDRYFLDQVVNHILSFEKKTLVTYKGNYSQFEKEKHNRLLLQQKSSEKLEKKRDELVKFIRRFSAGTRSKQAQSRMKQLEKMPDMMDIHRDTSYEFEFYEAPQLGNPVIQFDQISFGYEPKNPLFTDVDFGLYLDDRIGLLGLNGAGKSTLIKLIAGKIHANSGDTQMNPNIRIGYFAQHQVDALHMNENALWHMQQIATGIKPTVIRAYLGRFAFSNDKTMQKIASFSGGEKARLSLALIIWQRPNLLLLDEPTNHLDMEMKDALTMALQTFQGVLILVSHDRHLLEACVDQFFLIDDGEVSRFDGDLDDYTTWSKQKRTELFKRQKQSTGTAKTKPSNSSNTADVSKIEADITKFQKKLLKLNHEMAETDYTEHKKLLSLNHQIQETEENISQLEAKWLDLQEKG